MKTIIANWKMNLGVRESSALARGVMRGLRGKKVAPEVILAPSFTALADVSKIVSKSRVQVASQNMHSEETGAFTGEVSSKHLKELGVDCVILGHSERRQYFNESDYEVNKKVVRALAAGIDPVICVGESAKSREAGDSEGFVSEQLDVALKDIEVGKRHKIYIAYEPIWAIGTGKEPTIKDVEEMHGMIREKVEELGINGVHVLYGGSVNPENAYEFLNSKHVDGVLVGGASNRIGTLMDIINVAIDIEN